MEINTNVEERFINKVEESGILTIDLEAFYPKEAIVIFDLKEYLFMGLILKEKDFREALKNLDLSIYNNKNVGIVCSADAVIPMWAYMLIASVLEPIAKNVLFGDEDFVHRTIFMTSISAISVNDYIDKRVVIKGCGDKSISENAYVAITMKLRRVVKSIMYGEPCSTVPIYKRKS